MNVNEFASLSLSQLEVKTNISRSNWSKYFNSRISPRLNTLTKAAEKLDMSVVDVIKGIEIKREKILSNEAA